MIPRDIPNLDSMVVYKKKSCLNFFNDAPTFPGSSLERRKKDCGKNHNEYESHYLSS